LKKDFEYYLKNRSELKQKFGGSFLIIQNQSILSSLPTFKEAIQFLNTKTGDFLVQEINESTDSQTALFSL
tara:strand:+ start:283 stop:495 length:213 start_codon:yes stop_codon:yes gene_type:complete